MAVRVRLFAALREAAGVAEFEVEPGPLPDLLDRLRERFGSVFSQRLEQASVLVDGRRRARDDALVVGDGAEIALLPPFSGGAARPVPDDGRSAAPGQQAAGGEVVRRGRHAAQVRPAAAAEPPPVLPLVFALVAIAALLIGPLTLGIVAVLLGLGAAFDLATLLGRSGSRPLLPAVAVTVIGAPLAVAFSDGAIGAVAPLVAGAALLAFVLVIVGGIREHVTAVLGSTAIVVLVAGLGGAGLAALPWQESGLLFTLAVLALVAAAQLATGVLHFVARRPGLLRELLAPAVATTLTALVLASTLDPELSPLLAARLALVAVGAAVCARRLRSALADTLIRPPRQATPRGSPSRGRLAEATCGLLLAAPLAYALTRTAG